MAIIPLAPERLEDTGVSSDLVFQLVTKTLHLAGELTGSELAARLGVSFAVVEPALTLLKRDHHCEIAGGTHLGAPSYLYRLTDSGRVRAALFLDDNHYVGALPVPLDQYTAYMNQVAQEHATRLNRDVIRNAFSHLVLGPRTLDQLGPAITARHSLFVYGPPGNGKTVIAQAVQRVLTRDIAVPYALSIDGSIIRVFDPGTHQRLEEAPDQDEGLERRDVFDRRWVPCHHPLVTVGGELTLDALDLSYSPSAGFYRAPLQMLANGGVLVIDDFGRQQASPRGLLNRWMVPLESRVDYLTLQTGQKFQIPFEVFVVFATNLKPADLVDEAFLRRIRYKVLAESPTVSAFMQIFENYCRDNQLAFDPSVADYLVTSELAPRGVALRGCQPRDLIEQALAIASYLGRPRVLTRDLLTQACASYFVDDRNLASA